MCICDSKKTKTVPESMRGRTGGSLLPLLFSFLSPSTPFSLLPFFPLSPVSLIPPTFLPLLFSFLSPSTPFSLLPFFPLSPVSLIPPPPPPFSHPLSPFSHLSFLPSPCTPHLCGHDCCEYHTHICVAQGWKFNMLVA